MNKKREEYYLYFFLLAVAPAVYIIIKEIGGIVKEIPTAGYGPAIERILVYAFLVILDYKKRGT